jgi:aconitate hydratase
MPLNLSQKIIKEHLISGEMVSGKEIGIRIDQTLTQDATGTMAYLQFEAMGIPRVRTSRSVSYVDHNMLQTDFMNADDHRYLQSVAARYGLYFSRPGNGICHQVHRERFAVPGETLLGSDSHTPTCGGLGMLAMGAGGLDVAVAMAGAPFYLSMPRILGVHLKGSLQPWVTGKDVILELLRQLTVKGGVGRIIEYFGEGVASLSVSDRFTITNMGAELGATTSVFPSDEQTKRFLVAQQREGVWQSLCADHDANYDEILVIDLNQLEPMIAQPHSPDAVVRVREVKGMAVQQVCVGSCTNSSYHDLAVAAFMMQDRAVHPGVSFTLTPGSKQVFEMIAGDGNTLTRLIAAGARVLESACGPCIGMGQAPSSGAVSIRSFNRNFEGRSGTLNAKVYLASPETCTACALTGEITDPRDLGLKAPAVIEPVKFPVNDNMLIPPPKNGETIEVIRGPNIKPLPAARIMPENLRGQILLKVGDNITTDHIMPAGAKVLPLRSNIPAISEFVFERVDSSFPKRAKESGGGFILGGANYGQGSSREHAALAPMYLGVRAVLGKSFARIHGANLINFGILPLTFEIEGDYDRFNQDDMIELPEVRSEVESGNSITVRNVTRNFEVKMKHAFTKRQIELLLAGGLLNHIKQGSSGN